MMVGPMLVLAACCTFIGVAPAFVAPVLQATVEVWGGEATGQLAIAELAPLVPISIMAGILLVLLAIGMVVLNKKCSVATAPRGGTWGCGYAAPNSRMQYTSSSFAKSIVALFRMALQPREHRPEISELFPSTASYHSEVDDTVLQQAVLPGTKAIVWLFSWARYLQQGSIHAYLFYILAITVVLVLWK